MVVLFWLGFSITVQRGNLEHYTGLRTRSEHGEHLLNRSGPVPRPARLGKVEGDYRRFCGFYVFFAQTILTFNNAFVRHDAAGLLGAFLVEDSKLLSSHRSGHEDSNQFAFLRIKIYRRGYN